MTSFTARPRSPAPRVRAFTLVEVMLAATLSVFVLAGVLSANLQIMRGRVRVAHYVELDSQVRRALDFAGRDLRTASALV